MTDPGGVPTPEENRAAWLAAHPGAAEVSQDQAAGQVASQLGSAAPDPGVSDEQLGERIAAKGAAAGLPYEEQMNALMEQLKALTEQVGTLQRRDEQRQREALTAHGEPILMRYANAVRDKLAAHIAANPGSGDHFAEALGAAGNLATAAEEAIKAGANDLGKVNHYAAFLDRFFDRGHARTAPGHLRHLDLSAATQDLQALLDESWRLSPGNPATAAARTAQPALTSG